MTDHVQEQEMEIEALEAILMDEFKEIHSGESGLNTSNRCFQITLSPQDDDADQSTTTPDEPPLLNVKRLKDIKLNDSLEDCMLWDDVGEGLYSVKACTKSFYSADEDPFRWTKCVWQGLVPPRVEVFLWQVSLNKLAVRVELKKRGIIGYWGIKLALPADPSSILNSWLRLAKWFLAKYPLLSIQVNSLIGDPSLADKISATMDFNRPVLCWSPPPVDFFKFNVNGAVSSVGMLAGIGGILRDWNRVKLMSFSEKLGVSSTLLFKFVKDIADAVSENEVIASENLGMAMIYTLVTSAKEWLSERYGQDADADDVEEEESTKDEVIVPHGEPVTVDTFLAWRERFEAELALERAKLMPESALTAPKERGSQAGSGLKVEELLCDPIPICNGVRGGRIVGCPQRQKGAAHVNEESEEEDEEDIDFDDDDFEDDEEDMLEHYLAEKSDSSTHSSKRAA
ncbi:glutamate dehydrogenase family protein [Hibiscus syriacus]|uniref:Glutamate dehydrogenase family protein n=1 Tax=Hibiscus syriacus TaxID=106335 RepID=A0A6A3BFW2_HIBSY|nr:glutamate dehydrogenase family protein [Hibiscus syriacus]